MSVCMELYNYKEALFDSNFHDDHEYSILDLEPPTTSWFAPESTNLSSHHQLCSLPPAIGPALNLGTSQEPEAAAAEASQGSSSTQADRSSRTRNLEEDYDQHSSRGFQIFFDDSSSEGRKKRRLLAEKDRELGYYTNYEPDMEAMAKMKEMIYLAAALRPLSCHSLQEDAAKAKRPKRKNVRVSTDPQTVAARQRRERIGDRLRVLQKLVPGGSKMDTATMLDEAANYLGFLKSRVAALETLAATPNPHFPTLLMQHHHHHHPFPPPHQNPNPRPPSSLVIDHQHHHSDYWSWSKPDKTSDLDNPSLLGQSFSTDSQ